LRERDWASVSAFSALLKSNTSWLSDFFLEEGRRLTLVFTGSSFFGFCLGALAGFIYVFLTGDGSDITGGWSMFSPIDCLPEG